MTILTSILLFLITFFKSVFDLYISQLLFKNDQAHMSMIDAVKLKREREYKSTTLVFVLIALLSAANIWGSVMNDKEQEIENLKVRVETIESILFPDSGPSFSVQLDGIMQEIEEFKSEVGSVLESKANKTELDRAMKILAKLELVLKAEKDNQHTRVMHAGASR